MIKYTHGGECYDKEIRLDVSVNINPFGLPESVREALHQSIDEFATYPDDTCSRLRQEIARGLSKQAQISAEDILCGNGAADLIYRFALAKKAKHAIVLAPTFSEYEQALQLVGTKVTLYMLKKETNFSVTTELLSLLTSDVDVLFLCNPNNPVGNVIEMPLLLQILKHCKKNEITLMVDECFLEFTMCYEANTLITECLAYENLCVLKAFTKTYAMAGLRLGYVVSSNHELLRQMKHSGAPWSVSTPAQIAGIAALTETAYVQKTREYIKWQREWMKGQLEGFGFKVYESEANYLLFEAKETLYTQLLRREILIRQCGNYYGLDQTYYRVAIKLEEENKEVIQAIKGCGGEK